MTDLLYPAHQDTVRMLREFNAALADKLARSELKYGYSNNWLNDDWESECRAQLLQHVEKGDPLDVAAYAAFCWARGWSTAEPGAHKPTLEERKALEADFAEFITPESMRHGLRPIEDREPDMPGDERG